MVDFDDFEEETIARDVDIIYGTLFDLMGLLKVQSKLEAKYLKKYMEVVKAEKAAEIDLEVKKAQIMEKLRKEGHNGKNIPPSAWQEARRSIIPLDLEYQSAKKRHNRKLINSMWFNGLFERIVNKGWRLKYLIISEHKALFGDSTVTGKDVSEFDSMDEKINSASDKLKVD